MKKYDDLPAAKKVEEQPMVEDKLKQCIDKGLNFHRVGNYEAAYDAFTQCVGEFPNSAKLFESRSQSAMLTGRLDIAQTDAERAVLLDPNSLRAKIRLLKALVKRGVLTTAVQVGNEIFSVDPTNSAALGDYKIAQLNIKRLEEARTRLTAGKYQDAKRLAQTVQTESPGSRDASMVRAEAHVGLGELDDAYALTTRVLRDDEGEQRSDNSLLNLRARIFFEQERFDQCTKHLQEVLRSDPDDSKAAKLLKRVRKIVRVKAEGDENFKIGKYQEAFDAYSQTLIETEDAKLSSFQSKLYCNRAAASSSMGKYEEAIGDCDKAIELDQGYGKAYTRRALCSRSLGGKERLERAVLDYEKAEQLLGETNETRENIRKTKMELKIAKRKNYYGSLGITNNESSHTTEDIKKAYKRAALKYHPDRHTNSTEDERNDAEAKFKDVSEALMVLSDPEKRRLYDRGMDLEEINAHSGGGGGGSRGGFGGGGFDPSMFARGGGGGGFGGGYGGYDDSDGYPF